MKVCVCLHGLYLYCISTNILFEYIVWSAVQDKLCQVYLEMENTVIKIRICKQLLFFSLAFLIDEHHQTLGKKAFQRYLQEALIIKSKLSYIKN